MLAREDCHSCSRCSVSFSLSEFPAPPPISYRFRPKAAQLPTVTATIAPAPAPAPVPQLVRASAAAVDTSVSHAQPASVKRAHKLMNDLQTSSERAWQAAQTAANASFAQLQQAVHARHSAIATQMQRTYSEEMALLESRRV